MPDSPASTSIPHQALPAAARPRRGFNPLQLFADHAFAARLWFVTALVLAGYCAIQPYLLIRAYRSRERVVILDASGTFHVSPLLAFEEAGKLHEQHALLACLALFQRNPDSADYPELLEKLFLPEAVQKAASERAASADEFKAKQLHQKVEVLKLTVLETRENLVLVQAEGQLVRTGLFQGRVFTEAPPLRVRLTLVRNPNLAINARYPLAVWQYDAQF